MIDRRYVDLFANGARVSLEVAEREIMLTYVLKILADAGILKKLAFKGGTCLRKCIYGKDARFSLDLDFTKAARMAADDLILDLVAALTKPAYGISFNVTTKDFYVADDRSSCGAVIRYRHDWHGGVFKLEISLRERPSLPLAMNLLKPQVYFKHLEFPVFSIGCFQFEELLSEKIRAASQRVRSRDLYDMALAASRPFNSALVRLLTFIKCWNVREVFKPQQFLEKIESGRYDWEDLRQLVRRSERIHPEKLIAICRKRYQFLLESSRDETCLMADAKRHQLKELPVKLLKNHQT